jgi:16S rRNA (cytosine967-C5)-methyltransferase
MKKNDRVQALLILKKVLEDKVTLSQAMLSKKQLTSFSKEICFGVCRHYFRLQAIAECLLDKRPKVVDVWLVLLIGLYQLNYMQKPDYAVVKETVALLEGKNGWAKNLINAVLRRFCRERAFLSKKLENSEDFYYGHPQWFIQRLKTDWPDHWQAILEANDKHPPMSLRINNQRTNRENYLKQLEQVGLKAYPHAYSPVGIRLEVACEVYDLPGFSQGDVSVQDESAQLAALLLDLYPGLRVLDACCAPGGKTAHLLEMESKLHSCVALDVAENRLQRVKENLSRLNLQATLVKGDALKPETWWDGNFFDRILLDAPCSATGVIRRHPDIKLLRTEVEIDKVIQLQANLLRKLWSLLTRGGLLVYVTCSVLKEENEQQVAQFMAEHSDCKLVEGSGPWGQNTGYGWQIFPQEHGGDGFFYSTLRKD